MHKKRCQVARAWHLRRILAALVCIAGTLGLAAGVDPGKPRWTALANYDIRVHGGQDLVRLVEENSGRLLPQLAVEARQKARERHEALARLRASIPGIEARISKLTESTEVVRNSSSSLTPPVPRRSASRITIDFLRSHADLYGLAPEAIDDIKMLGESRSRSGGLRVVRLQQTVHGIPIFQSETRAVVDGDDRLIATVGRIVPWISSVPMPKLRELLSAEESLRASLRTLRIRTDSLPLYRMLLEYKKMFLKEFDDLLAHFSLNQKENYLIV